MEEWFGKLGGFPYHIQCDVEIYESAKDAKHMLKTQNVTYLFNSNGVLQSMGRAQGVLGLSPFPVQAPCSSIYAP